MALELARLAAEAGILNVVTGHGEEAGAALAANPGIAHLGYTQGKNLSVYRAN